MILSSLLTRLRQSSSLRWTRIIFLVALSGLLFTGELLLSFRAKQLYPAQGRLVDIGGRVMQIDCRGSGSPVVVLESGGDMLGSLSWTPVHDDLARITRTCAYSRAGIMWSDANPHALTADAAARDLHLALTAAAEKPPYVLVGHSRGGVYNMIFNGLYGNDVAGLVFVDPSHPDQEQRAIQAGFGAERPVSFGFRVGVALRWTGVARLFSEKCALPYAPQEMNRSCGAYFPHSLKGYLNERGATAAVRDDALRFRNFGDRPVIVLSSQLRQSSDTQHSPELAAQQSRSLELWGQLHTEIASWSTRGERRIIPDSHHGLQWSHPAAVVAAVRDVMVSL
ncbi:MAG: alpha/beta hydrolase [Candidatus Obscuribacterales bacterium]|nr:alpha/beta hydrolase [Steroidobacteraceae bacterium]